MVAEVIDGKEVAKEIKDNISQYIKILEHDNKAIPELAVILVGEDPASLVYVGNKKKTAAEVGIKSSVYTLSQQTSQAELIDLIVKLNNDKNVNGILVQLPLPKHINSDEVLEYIDPIKDVDGLSSINIGGLMKGDERVNIPCTPLGCMALIKKVKTNLSGLHAVVVGRSNLVGRPVAELLIQENCTVTVCHSRTVNIENITKQADILVAATGIANLVKKDWVKPNAIVIDVGINRNKEGKLCGDVDFAEVVEIAGYITKVPGGVGPMTIAFLLVNTVLSYCRQNNLVVPKLS